MRALIACNDPHFAGALRDLLVYSIPGLIVDTAEHLDQLQPGRDVYLVHLNNVHVDEWEEPEDRVAQVVERCRALRAPIIAWAGWPEDAGAVARDAGWTWLDYERLPAGLVEAVRDVLRYWQGDTGGRSPQSPS